MPKTPYQSTAHMPVMILWTNDVQIFLHLHAFLHADSGIGSCPTALFTKRKKTADPAIVKITEFNSMVDWLSWYFVAGGRCPSLRGIPVFQKQWQMNILKNDQEKRSTWATVSDELFHKLSINDLLIVNHQIVRYIYSGCCPNTKRRNWLICQTTYLKVLRIRTKEAETIVCGQDEYLFFGIDVRSCWRASSTPEVDQVNYKSSFLACVTFRAHYNNRRPSLLSRGAASASLVR